LDNFFVVLCFLFSLKKNERNILHYSGVHPSRHVSAVPKVPTTTIQYLHFGLHTLGAAVIALTFLAPFSNEFNSNRKIIGTIGGVVLIVT
jgi:hypothetical protein